MEPDLTEIDPVRFELLEGEALCGVFTMRRTAMADAELLAAKRRVAFVGEQKLRAGARGELTRSTHEVCVNVRLGDVRDAEPLGVRGGDVLLDIAVGIHDEGLAGPLAADEITRLGELGIVEALEKHGMVSEMGLAPRNQRMVDGQGVTSCRIACRAA